MSASPETSTLATEQNVSYSIENEQTCSINNNNSPKKGGEEVNTSALMVTIPTITTTVENENNNQNGTPESNGLSNSTNGENKSEANSQQSSPTCPDIKLPHASRTSHTYFPPKAHFPTCERYNPNGIPAGFPRFPKGHYNRRRPSPTHSHYNILPKPIPTQPLMADLGPSTTASGQHIVHLHVNPGETISLHMGDHMEVIQGPATVRMISNNNTPPIPMPVQVPPGHMVQQLVDETGTLQHIILSPQPPMAVPLGASYTAGTSPNSATPPIYGFPPPLPPFPAAFPAPPHLQPGFTHAPNCNGHQNNHENLMYNKDERTQKQYMRLRKKLEGRQKKTKHSNNTEEKGGHGDNSFEIDNFTDETIQNLSELVSKIEVPTVEDIEARSALVKWKALSLQLEKKKDQQDGGTEEKEIIPQEIVEASDLQYEVLLAEKGKEDKQGSVYCGPILEFKLTNLKPNTEYSACVLVLIEDLKGQPSTSVTFSTKCCEPDKPLAPKLSSRNKNSLSLKWNAPLDNGSKITKYILEMEESTDKFVEVFSGNPKQHKITKLNISTCYRFRLAAINSIGKSAYSDICSFYTSGTVPSMPSTPILKEATIKTLHLSWEQRPSDDEFTLQMETQRHGFLAVYCGHDTSYTCLDLMRNTEYKFRLAASNEEGMSPWSYTVNFSTLPDRPSPPGRPGIKGRPHARSCNLAWDVPKDNGGSPIEGYHLEMDKENGFEKIYNGPLPEFLCENLRPGTSYYFRVNCKNQGGTSDFSDFGCIITNPVPPGKCHPPRLVGKPKSSSLQLKWMPPDYDGGATIVEYEVKLYQADPSDYQLTYKGSELECTVTGLLPGTQYHLEVRAQNRAGPAEWSEHLEVQSGAAVPDSPKPPSVSTVSPHNLMVSWMEPPHNGAPITEYRLEGGSIDKPSEITKVSNSLSCEVRGLQPATEYFFKVQAVNSAGIGPVSETSSGVTAPSSPGSVNSIELESAAATTVTLAWNEPISNGSDILRYIVEIGEDIYTTERPCICIENLHPKTSYRVRVQASNGIGSGLFSPMVRVSTMDLPPMPPHLQCIAATHNSLKLKWANKNPDFLNYFLEMETKNGSFVVLYQGTSVNFKVTRLHETSEYRFRMYASNEAGEGPPSTIYTFTTTKAPPPPLKAPRITTIDECSCMVEWHTVPPIADDPISYHLYMATPPRSDYSLKYKGSATSYKLTNLEPGQEYMVKVQALRHSGEDCIIGAFSPVNSFLTPAKETPSSELSGRAESYKPVTLSDQQWAIIILCGFTLFAIIFAIAIQKLLS